MLTVLDEHSREYLGIEVDRKLSSDDVLETLTRLFAEHGPPATVPEAGERLVRPRRQFDGKQLVP